MPSNDVSVVLAHGAWADGSSWAKVIGPLTAEGITVAAAECGRALPRHRTFWACVLNARGTEGVTAMRS